MLCIACSGAAFSEETFVVRTAAQDASEPKYVAQLFNGKKVATGFCVDLMRAIERSDRRIHFTGDQDWEPVTRLEADIQVGALDVACGLQRNSARMEHYRYLEPAVFSVRYFLVARADDPVKVSSWDDVRALGADGIVLINRGVLTPRMQALKGVQYDDAAVSAKINLQKLLAGRGRFFLYRSPGLQAEITAAGVSGKVRICSNALILEDFYLVISKNAPAAMADALDNALKKLAGSGELTRLQQRWLS
ncbi:MAG: transporter substrate-binding domain-containing protein [Burkholderiaceae bacterium]|nr:transporter substrate-binding domain-containing protein [Burkholderiaceae bacterium]